MNIFKLITSLLLTILPIAVLIRDWKFHDKRTKRHHNVTRAIIVFWLIGSITATYFVWSDSAQLDELVAGKDKLLLEIKKYQTDLDKKGAEIKMLEQKAKSAERNIVSIYDFNGDRIEIVGGMTRRTASKERQIYAELARLEKENKPLEVIDLSSRQIKKTPTWLTPYLFRGVAYMNTRQDDKAASDIEHVVDHAGEDPNYYMARQILEELNKR